MKPNSQKNQGKFNKKPNQNHGKPGPKHKFKPKQKKTVSKLSEQQASGVYHSTLIYRRTNQINQKYVK